MARKMLRNVEIRGVHAARNGPSPPPTLPGARWPSRRLARRIALVQGNSRQGPPTLRHQCQLVQDPLSLELNRRLVVKSRLSEVFSAVNASVGFPHFFVISSNLTTINTRTIGSVLTLHRHFHLSPLDPLARNARSAAGATCSVAQSKRGWSILPTWFLAGATLRGWGRASVMPDPVRRQRHRRAVGGLKKGTQLVIDSSCVPVSAVPVSALAGLTALSRTGGEPQPWGRGCRLGSRVPRPGPGTRPGPP